MPPLRASTWTMTTATTAPATADPWMANIAAPAIMASRGADRGAAGYAEHERVGEGVAEQRLQQHAGERQQTSDPECGQGARQAHGQRHGPGDAVAGTQQCRQNPSRREFGAADEQGADEYGSRQQQQQGQALPGAAARTGEGGNGLQITAAGVDERVA